MKTPTYPGRRRALGIASSIVAASLALTACGQDTGDGSGDADAANDGDVVLQFAWWGGEARHAYTQEITELYEEQNPGVQIEPTYAEFSGYWDRLNTNIAGGNMPDIMQQDVRYVREYVSRDLLADLSEYVGSTIDTEHLDPAVAGTGEVDGGLYGIPNAVNIFAMIVDPAALEQANVEAPDYSTWSWQDWIDMASEVSANTGGELYGAQPRPQHDAMLSAFARQRGEELFNADGSVGISRETLIEYWTMVTDLHESGAAPEATLTLEMEAQALEGSILATQQGATMPAWSNQLNTLEELSGRTLEMVPFPGESTEEHPGMFVKPSQFWSISAQTEHPEQAADFVDFLLNDPDVAEIMLSERGLPVNLERRAEVADALTTGDQQAAAFLGEVGPTLQASPSLPPPGGGAVEDIVLGVYEALLFDQISIEEAADQYLAEIETAIS